MNEKQAIEMFEILLKDYCKFEELRDLINLKDTYDYMECCALERMDKEIKRGAYEMDWTSMDCIQLAKGDLVIRLNRLLDEAEEFLKRVIS